MAGIYLHIPFCKSRCNYCDFYSTTALQHRNDYVMAMMDELYQRRSFLNTERIETVYLGGGTPSLLTTDSITMIIDYIRNIYNLSPTAEITLEANPSDLNPNYLLYLRHAGVNRLSIGVQSFQNRLLALLARRHTAQQTIEVVQQAQQQGFDNISIDLIYALPTQTLDDWQHDIEQALHLGIQHISTYCLTYEKGTPLYDQLHANKLRPIDDDTANHMYQTLYQTLTDNGFERYEVSNFCLPHFHSRHNSAYWNFTPYLGIGAAAHSYHILYQRNGEYLRQRSWNIADVNKYIEGVKARNLLQESEILTTTDHYNELVMLSLRTKNGINLCSLNEQERNHCLQEAQQFVSSGKLNIENNHLIATNDGINILNYIIEHLMQ